MSFHCYFTVRRMSLIFTLPFCLRITKDVNLSVKCMQYEFYKRHQGLSCYHYVQTIVTLQFRCGGCDVKWLSFSSNFCMQDLSSVVVLHLHKSPQLQATTSNAASVTSCSMSYNTVLQCSVKYESRDITDKFKTVYLPVRLRSTLDYV